MTLRKTEPGGPMTLQTGAGASRRTCLENKARRSDEGDGQP
jgi:hypothetical protein